MLTSINEFSQPVMLKHGIDPKDTLLISIITSCITMVKYFTDENGFEWRVLRYDQIINSAPALFKDVKQLKRLLNKFNNRPKKHRILVYKQNPLNEHEFFYSFTGIFTQLVYGE